KSSLVVRQDGTVWAFGDNDSGELGDGTYADHFSPALVVNKSGNDVLDVLDLDPATPNQIPAKAMPLFLVQTEKGGNPAALTLSVDIHGLFADLPQGLAASPVSYNVYVAGNLPLSDQQNWYEIRPPPPPAYSVIPWVFASPMLGFLYNVGLVTQYDKVRLDILNNADLSGGAGASIYVGYGVDSDEMLASNRFRKILDIKSATNTQSYSVLTINKTGNGTVTAQANVICGDQCSESYLPGTPVTLIATPAGGANFTGWSDACAGQGAACTLTMDASKIVSATFGTSSNNGAVVTLITHYYQSILGRAPEPSGLAYYQDSIARAQSLGDVKPAFRQMGSDFFNSPEYLDRKTSNTDYITNLYKTFLQRDPDSAGLQFYRDRLAKGESRNTFVTDFTNSPEFAQFMKNLGF
ncbi:MAG: DUF4214 domain-containing protein, partial [Pseudomonadota bacterium]